MATEIPNLRLLNTLLEPDNTACFELNTSGELSSPAATYNTEAATALSHSAGRELGNMMASLRNDDKQSKQQGDAQKKAFRASDDFQERTRKIQQYRVDMMVNAFGALFTVIDRATRLEIELKTVNEQARAEKTELLEATQNLVNFIENNLIRPFITGFNQSNLGLKSNTRVTALEGMQTNARNTSDDIETTSRAHLQTEPLYTQAHEAAITRIFAPNTTT